MSKRSRTFIKRLLKEGDRVGFRTKEGNELVFRIGTIIETMPAAEARRRGVKIGRSGRVLKLRSKGKIYYKHQTTVLDPRVDLVSEKDLERRSIDDRLDRSGELTERDCEIAESSD